MSYLNYLNYKDKTASKAKVIGGLALGAAPGAYYAGRKLWDRGSRMAGKAAEADKNYESLKSKLPMILGTAAASGLAAYGAGRYIHGTARAASPGHRFDAFRSSSGMGSMGDDITQATQALRSRNEAMMNALSPYSADLSANNITPDTFRRELPTTTAARKVKKGISSRLPGRRGKTAGVSGNFLDYITRRLIEDTTDKVAWKGKVALGVGAALSGGAIYGSRKADKWLGRKEKDLDTANRAMGGLSKYALPAAAALATAGGYYLGNRAGARQRQESSDMLNEFSREASMNILQKGTVQRKGQMARQTQRSALGKHSFGPYGAYLPIELK